MRNFRGLYLGLLLVFMPLFLVAGCITLTMPASQNPSGDQAIPSGPSAPGPTAPAPPAPPAPPTPPANQSGLSAPTAPKAPADQSGIGALQDDPPARAALANWSGVWLCGQWGRLTLSQSGDQVTGSYTYENGKLTGYATGNSLVGIWSEAPTYNAPKDAGDVQFNLSADGNSFTGHWRYGSSGDWKPWNGNKDLSNQLPPGQN